jgi:hypothetical protein
MSDAGHNDPGVTRPDTGDTRTGGPGNGGSGLTDPLYAWASGPSNANYASETSVLTDPGGQADANPQRMGPERWVIGGGTVVALVAAFVAFTAGGTPSRAMPSPFTPQPAQSAPAQSGSGQGTPPTTCPSVTPAP